MSALAYSLSASRITVLLDGRYRAVPTLDSAGKKTAHAVSLETALKRSPVDLDEIRSLVNIPAYLALKTFGRIVVDDKDNIRLDGEIIDFGVVSTLKRVLGEGFDPTPMLKFVENVAENPDKTIAADLYPYLEQGGHPITDDGCFLAFKRVDDGYWSLGQGVGGEYKDTPDDGWVKAEPRVKYPLGGWARIDRALCDVNRQHVCGTGLHACSFTYLSQFHGGCGRILIIKINPRDVTSFPIRYEAKFRACLMEIVGEISEEDAKNHFVSAVDDRYPGTPEPANDETASDIAHLSSLGVKRAFDEAGVSQREFAELHGIARTTLQRKLAKG